jgi:hypothetical protein
MLTDKPDRTYDCTPETYINDTYSCEVGDLTGRLGPIEVGSDRIVTSKQVSDRHLPPPPVLEVCTWRNFAWPRGTPRPWPDGL